MRQFLTSFLFMLVVFAAGMVQAESYRLLPQDKITLRAMRWDTESSSYLRWDGISGDYSVAPDGTVMIPLVGQVQAQGRTTSELSGLLEQQLRREIGMSEPPKIAVEVAGHLSVYILGDVNSPGAYPYHPGMTVQQALALAGGPIRPSVQITGSNDYQVLRLGGEIKLLATQIEELENEQRRLIADLSLLTAGDDKDSVQLPEGLEGEILSATLAARDGQSERIRDLQNMLKEQISSLTAQLELRDSQIETVRQELENLNTLKEKGLTVSNRVTTMTNALNDLESKRLDQEIALLTARQQLNRAERDELELDDNARSQALIELNNVESELATLRTRQATARILQGELAAAGLLGDENLASEVVIRFTVYRGGDSSAKSFEATDTLLPGDTLEVSRTVVVTSN